MLTTAVRFDPAEIKTSRGARSWRRTRWALAEKARIDPAEIRTAYDARKVRQRLKAEHAPAAPAKVLQLVPIAPAPVVSRAQLMADWETRLAAEGMPADPRNDYERPNDHLDFLAAPGGGCRPIKRRASTDGDGNRHERGSSLGAWWVNESPTDDDGVARWDRVSAEVRLVVDGAIATAGAPAAALTAGQARVLGLWMQGLRQTEIAAREQHSKVTVHHKLWRALKRVGELLGKNGIAF